jgi:trehalose synthase
MVLGLPSIVFEDGGGLPEHIENGKTGFIVSSVLELGKRMNDLLRSPELRARIGPAAANSMRERYTVKAMLQRYNSLYRDALSKGAPGSVAGT